MTPSEPAFGADTPRLVGSAGKAQGGPLLIVSAAIHGNEPAGVRALRRVFAALDELEPELHGRVVGLIGNRGALLAGQRYRDSDLNRLWSRRKLAELASGDPAADTAEQKEQRELLAAIEVELAQPHAEVVHLDLHSTSGDSPPFIVQNGDARSLELARDLGVPVLHGLLKNLDGTVLELGAARGFTSIVLEGGQNEAETTIEHHESALWAAPGARAPPRAHRAQHLGHSRRGRDLPALRDRAAGALHDAARLQELRARRAGSAAGPRWSDRPARDPQSDGRAGDHAALPGTGAGRLLPRATRRSRGLSSAPILRLP